MTREVSGSLAETGHRLQVFISQLLLALFQGVLLGGENFRLPLDASDCYGFLFCRQFVIELDGGNLLVVRFQGMKQGPKFRADSPRPIIFIVLVHFFLIYQFFVFLESVFFLQKVAQTAGTVIPAENCVSSKGMLALASR